METLHFAGIAIFVVLAPFVVIALVFVGLITLTAALEKRLVWPYVPEGLAVPGSMPGLNAYAQVAGSAATEMGFVWIGAFGDGKGKLYKLRYNFFLSPERDIVALVGNGTMASVPSQSTWLYTLQEDGRAVATVDSQSAVETDLTGLTNSALAAGVGFYTLVMAHRRRTASCAARLFSPTDPLSELRAFRQSRTERLCMLGEASFLDASRAAWRYTAKGAARLAVRQYFMGLRRSFLPDKIRPAENSVRR